MIYELLGVVDINDPELHVVRADIGGPLKN